MDPKEELTLNFQDGIERMHSVMSFYSHVSPTKPGVHYSFGFLCFNQSTLSAKYCFQHVQKWHQPISQYLSSTPELQQFASIKNPKFKAQAMAGMPHGVLSRCRRVSGVSALQQKHWECCLQWREGHRTLGDDRTRQIQTDTVCEFFN